MLKPWYLLFVMSFVCHHAHGQKLFELLQPKQTGISFKNEIIETEEANVLAYEYFYNGGGVAVGDINNDGLQDLYFTANMRPDKLFLNLGGLKFKDITRPAKILNKPGWKTGVTMADVNGDGFLDIYVCYSGNGDAESRKNLLYLNNGNLTFSEKAKVYGIDDSGYSTQGAFFDYDRDGDLDLYVVNHNIKDYKDIELAQIKTSYDSLAADRLYKNENGFFKDVSKSSGITGNPISFGLGLTIGDLNNDRWPDIYVSNDYREHDYVYISNKNGTFSEKSATCLRHLSEFSMGNEMADFNNDGWLDIVTLDMLPEDNKRQKLLQGSENYEKYKILVTNGFQHQLMRNMLQLNNHDGTFSEVGQLAGVSNTDWSWSPLFADFDNDGFKDLFISNGYLRDYTNRDFLKYWGNYVVQKAVKMEKTLLMDLVKQMPSTLTKNYIFKNSGKLTFSNKSDDWGVEQLFLSHGAAYADLDNDGDLDLIINNVNEFASLYENKANTVLKQNYLQVQLHARGENVNALGGRVQLFHQNTSQTLELNPTRGFQSCSSTILHFGLGGIAKVDSLLVTWPSGNTQVERSVHINERTKITEDHGKEMLESRRSSLVFFRKYDSAIKFVHRDYDYNDFKRQPLLPFMLSHVGPVLAKADVNGDRLADVFIGASKGQGSRLLIQNTDGSFNETNGLFDTSKQFTATDAAFFDADGDGDEDLYVTSGSYHDYQEGNVLLQDRLFFNDGHGNFSVHPSLPLATSKSCVRPVDFDNDGDMDIFLGGRVVPGRYPEAPNSYLLQNDGRGNFSDATDKIIPEVRKIGMVTDAAWVDLNMDGLKDLIVVGEWMTVKIFINESRGFQDRTTDYFDQDYSGLWNTMAANDIDDDGDVDLIVGNLGLNTQIHAGPAQPAELWYSHFDNNGSVDPLLCFYIQGKSYPYVSRDELLDQLYGMRKKFPDYKSFADASLTDIFSTAELGTAKKWSATTLETCLFENINGKFLKKELPFQAQFSPVFSIQVTDINKDGKKDILLLGNQNFGRLKIGKTDSNYGMAFLQTEKMNFDYAPQTLSGLSIQGDVKDALLVETSLGQLLMVAVNGMPLLTYKFTR